jgi:DNA polymerase-3 subunit alpha
VVKYINECREMGIPVEPPDINVSDAYFTPHENAIRFGLAAVKNVGRNAIDSIVAARKEIGRFASIFEFCEKVDLRLLNRRVVESLIKAGAMDTLGNRAQLMAVLDRAMERAQKAQRDAELGQHGLFGVFEQDHQVNGNADRLPSVPEWDEHQRLASEKEVLGFFITGHPMEKYKDKLEDFRALSAEAIAAMTSGTGRDELYTAGIVSNVRVMKSRKGELYAQAILEDMTGTVDAIVFPEAYRRLQAILKQEIPMLVRCSVRVEEGSAAEDRHKPADAAGGSPAEVAAFHPDSGAAGKRFRGHHRCAAFDLPRAPGRGQSVVRCGTCRRLHGGDGSGRI